MTREPPRPVVQVHHRGDRGVDGILRLIELAGHDGPLEAMLSAMCDEIAAIAGSDIASIYVREDDRLVMRGNHGFSPAAIGATELAVGEGITGLVAECMRPVSAAHAAAESAYKHVPGLGEERFPVFVGVPLIGGGSAIGVLVLQRRDRPFELGEVTLATALGAPATLAIERRRATAVRSARLTGVAHVAGAVLGRAAVVPTVTALDGSLRFEAAGDADIDERSDATGGGRPAGSAGGAGGRAPRGIDRQLARLREDLGRAIKRLTDPVIPPSVAIGSALDRFALVLCDARLRERLSATAGQPAGLRMVAKEYARAPYRLGASSGDAAELAAEIEELCALLGNPRPLRAGAVWLADRIHTPVAIAAIGRGAAALVASDMIAPAAIALARAAGIPVVSDVAGLFGWARPGDLLGVDGAEGLVLVHPAPSDIERMRRARDSE